MRIEVRFKHIKTGHRRMGDRCPIALALKETSLPALAPGGIWVNGSCVKLYGHKASRRIVNLPPEAIEFIWRFDAGENPPPFAFDLPVEEVVDAE